MTTRATRKGATGAKRASKSPPGKRTSKPQPTPTPQAEQKHAGGRPTKFNGEVARTALKLYAKGFTDAEVAEFLEVVVATVHNWKNEHPEFLDAIKAAKVAWDSRVERKLAERAMGYSHEAVKIFCNKDGDITEARFTEHYPPDTAAGIFWLCNRQPDRWKQRVTHQGDPENPIVSETVETPEMKAALARVRKRVSTLESRLSK